jgi:hypothetical protein
VDFLGYPVPGTRGRVSSVTVTELIAEGSARSSGSAGRPEGAGRCRWCQRPLAERTGPGRPRQYCRQSCRQRDYEARRLAAERGLDEGEIIVTRARLDTLRDKLWVLACAIQDVDGDVARASGPADDQAALAWVMEAARPLVAELDS